VDVTTELDDVEHAILKTAMVADVLKILLGVALTVAFLVMLYPEFRLEVEVQVSRALYRIRFNEWMRARRKLWSKLPAWAQEAGEVRGLKPE